LSQYEAEFLELISGNKQMLEELAVVRELQLPDWYAAAGYVRNYIWDRLHGYTTRTPLNDIDVIYYDPQRLDETFEKSCEQRLRERTGLTIWSVKNQARMHVRNGEAPYLSIEDAIKRWPETVTAVAIRLEADDSVSYLCPHGLDEIFECRIKMSPYYSNEAHYRQRVSSKNWLSIWPKLHME
jgi:hypothetical protein